MNNTFTLRAEGGLLKPVFDAWRGGLGSARQEGVMTKSCSEHVQSATAPPEIRRASGGRGRHALLSYPLPPEKKSFWELTERPSFLWASSVSKVECC